MADLTQEQFNGLDQRRSVDDLNTILDILRRDGTLTADVPEATYASDEDREEAEANLDESINNSVLLAGQQGPPPVTDAEAANTKEQAEAEAEWNENQALVPPVPIEEVGSSDAGPKKETAAQKETAKAAKQGS